MKYDIPVEPVTGNYRSGQPYVGTRSPDGHPPIEYEESDTLFVRYWRDPRFHPTQLTPPKEMK